MYFKNKTTRGRTIKLPCVYTRNSTTNHKFKNKEEVKWVRETIVLLTD